MFVQVIQGHVSDVEGFTRCGQRWADEIRPGASGFLGSTMGVTRDGTAVVAARFESADAARANSDRPEQSAWWAEAQACFDGPVTFADSSDVETFLAGGSDAAGFVQVMRGTDADRGLIAEMDKVFSAVAPRWRPDVIGGVRAWTGPSDYIEVVYFTSEEQARANEQTPPPPELAARMGDFETMTRGVEYLDLTAPVFSS